MALYENDIIINSRGELTLGGISAVELAEKYKTPLYVMDENKIRLSMRAYTDAFKKYYPCKSAVCYASKAFCCREMYRICRSEGLWADVVSGGELYTALSAGFDPKHICFHGNNKTPGELRLAVDSGLAYIVVDNLTELAELEEIASEKKRDVTISLRIKPGIEAHTHDYVKTGQIDSKFGLAIENGNALKAVRKALDCRYLSLKGLNAHIGSQIFGWEPFVQTGKVMLRFIAEIKKKFGRSIEFLSLGGGFGVKYTEEDDPVPFEEYIRAISEDIVREAGILGTDLPVLAIEPGRSIVAQAGATLYTVGSVKEIEGVRNYVCVDGGMTDNPRFALYGSKYTFAVANRAGEPRDYTASIAGRCCEADPLGMDIKLQKPQPGDILAVFTTGAYNYSMASNYNRVPRPAVVMVRGGESRVIVRRETAEDLCRLDV